MTIWTGLETYWIECRNKFVRIALLSSICSGAIHQLRNHVLLFLLLIYHIVYVFCILCLFGTLFISTNKNKIVKQNFSTKFLKMV